jgi:hypothetical protein
LNVGQCQSAKAIAQGAPEGYPERILQNLPGRSGIQRPEAKASGGTVSFPASNTICLAAMLLAAVPNAWTQPSSAAQNAQQDASRARPGTDSDNTKAQTSIAVPLPKGKKLILADGSYQMVREYSVEGDRVRYWSVERSAWEEIPSKLVNWEATHQAEGEQSKQDEDLKAKIRASDLAERTRGIDVDKSLEIKPGLFLPDGVGFYVLEDRLIFVMKQSLAANHLSKGREVTKILTGIPIIPSKQNLEVPGVHAAMRLKTAEPEFFMRPDDGREPRFQLLRLGVSGNHRVVETINLHMSGEQVHYSKDVEFQTWTPATGVFRYTVNEKLAPGEYAFVELTNEGINGYVWDFGIDPQGTKSQK